MLESLARPLGTYHDPYSNPQCFLTGSSILDIYFNPKSGGFVIDVLLACNFRS
jgi:hypothetical protein